MTVQVAVFLVLDVVARPCPQRLRLVDVLVLERSLALLLHAHRKGDVVGVAAHQRAQPHRIGEFLRLLLQVQHHAGAALGPRDGLDRELPVGARLPAHGFLRRGIGTARKHLDALGDDERRIESNAELADELRILLLVAGQAFEEFRGTGLSDRAQVRDRFLAAHADAVVAYRQRGTLGIAVDPDRQVVILAEQVRI